MKKLTVARSTGRALWKSRGVTGKAAKRRLRNLQPPVRVDVQRRRAGHTKGFFSGFVWPLLGTFMLGAGIAYLLDPSSGRRRRALARDKAIHFGKVAAHRLDQRGRDLSQRLGGAMSELQSRTNEEYISDPVLAERVRSQLGRATSNPGVIHVAAHDGRITLSGPVLEDEVDRLLKEVAQVRGVSDVDNRLSIHQQSENIHSLQGMRPRSEGPADH